MAYYDKYYNLGFGHNIYTYHRHDENHARLESYQELNNIAHIEYREIAS